MDPRTSSPPPTADRVVAAIASIVAEDDPVFGGFFHHAAPPAWRAEDLVVYACGGGAGHRARARVLLERLGRGTIVDRSDALERVRGAKLVVVDTFPAGLFHEVDVASVPLRVLVSRYVRPSSYAGYEEHAAKFSVRLAPYPEEACEWEDCALCTHHVGHLVRRIAIDEGPELPLLGIGDRALLPDPIRRRLSEDVPFVSGPFATLPRARASIAAGAGYNLTYELVAAGIRVGHVPFERRYDNQFLRTERLGNGLYGSADVERLLER